MKIDREAFNQGVNDVMTFRHLRQIMSEARMMHYIRKITYAAIWLALCDVLAGSVVLVVA